ncbi:MAG: hypothetical protein WCJ19_00140 [bacterium]
MSNPPQASEIYVPRYYIEIANNKGGSAPSFLVNRNLTLAILELGRSENIYELINNSIPVPELLKRVDRFFAFGDKFGWNKTRKLQVINDAGRRPFLPQGIEHKKEKILKYMLLNRDY